MALDPVFTGFLIRIAPGAGVVLLVIILPGITIPERLYRHKSPLRPLAQGSTPRAL